MLRTNIAYDRELAFLGLIGTVEFLYSKMLQDINYRNLNLFPERPRGPTAGRSQPVSRRRSATSSC